VNDLQIFNNPEFGEIRVLSIGGEPWFIAKEISDTLGYTQSNNMIKRLEPEDISNPSKMEDLIIEGIRKDQTIINESGLYAAILGSQIQKAKPFKKWVTSEVLPSIRKTGSYIAPTASPNELILMMAQANIELEKKITAIETKLDTAIKVFSAPDKDHWKGDVEEKIKSLAKISGYCGMTLRGRLYVELEKTANVNLNSRVIRMRERYKKQGYTYKESKAVSKLDAISKDTMLKPIFEGIIRKYQAIYN
jgi:prophage antirepressor-like protein